MASKIQLTDEQWLMFEKLCEKQCTEQEIADYFKCILGRVTFDHETLNERIKEKYGVTFSKISKELNSKGKRKLREALWDAVLKRHDVKAAIFLSKQYLGMADKTESTVAMKSPHKILLEWLNDDKEPQQENNESSDTEEKLP